MYTPALPEVPSAVLRAPADMHAVQFYESDDFLCGAVAGFIAAGLDAGEPALVIATEEHRLEVCRRLASAGIDLERALRPGRLTFLDARELLSHLMVQGMPDEERFRAHVGRALQASRAGARGARVRAFGEMVDLLWRDGNPGAAIRLEELWNELGQTQSFSLLCAYVMGNFGKESDAAAFQQVCGAHSHVVPTERFADRDGLADARLREIAVLQQRARSLESEIEHRKELEAALRGALAERRHAQEALRASQEDLADFFDNAVEGLHCVGPDGVILWANGAELELLGYARAEYVGHRISEFHLDREVVDDILARLGRGETVKDREVRLRCKDGSTKHVVLHSNALFRGGKFVHSRCFSRDVTDRRRLEDELRGQNEELSRAVRFSEMFVGILGHDLRNPLSAITTAASLLVRRAESEKVAKPSQRILSSAGRMARMIDQLLDFTRIRLGKGLPLARSSMDLGAVCRLAIDELDSASAAQRVRLEATGDLVGGWDGDRLAQLVSNLLGNALAHGARDFPVTLRVDGTDERTVLVEVRNAGVVPAALLEVMFEPFRSTHDTKQQGSSGLGLGLYISQQIAVAHGGSIEVASCEPEGTCFTVRLPRVLRKGHVFGAP
jgi:PAS domain S-box-containing protein